MADYQAYQQDRQTIRRQTEAEFEVAQALENAGVDPGTFMAEWGLSSDEFNRLAHLVCGVADEGLQDKGKVPRAARAIMALASLAACKSAANGSFGASPRYQSASRKKPVSARA